MAERFKLLTAWLLTTGSLVGLIIQLSLDNTPGTGNISPVSITCIAFFVGQVIWFIAFARKKEPPAGKHPDRARLLCVALSVAAAIYLVIPLRVRR
ncbi:hypothetical protein [Arthrobacter sp. ISL-69]|uniref:hypothetical protein n=1 Tax=Arthrobacter sp. ISL-69 TaxID=2819113 RepID=UPI001BE7F902|nr:hypothetical protein [Arthrobacter sp. ISL-69]MBT2535041.1 hypothetical protein [Arthrobacter sp. ISL-69]